MAQEVHLCTELASGRMSAEKIADEIAKGTRPLSAVFLGISSKLPRVKFGCSKILLLLSEKHPDLLRGKMDRIAEPINGENQILKWNAIAILGNLAAADPALQIENLLRRLYGFISCGELITANTAITALGKIGRAYPEQRRRITSQLLKTEHAAFDTDECRNIAIGKAVLALEMFTDPLNPGKPVLEFVRRQTDNRRSATANKAKAFMRKCTRKRDDY